MKRKIYLSRRVFGSLWIVVTMANLEQPSFLAESFVFIQDYFCIPVMQGSETPAPGNSFPARNTRLPPVGRWGILFVSLIKTGAFIPIVFPKPCLHWSFESEVTYMELSFRVNSSPRVPRMISRMSRRDFSGLRWSGVVTGTSDRRPRQ